MDKTIPIGYYTYAYINKKTGFPYYIGKGSGRRLYVSHKKHGVTTPRDIGQIVVFEQGLTELGALALERRYIKWYGRKDNGTGVLHNKTDGGDSTIGHIKSARQIEKHRAQLKGRPCWTDGNRTIRRWKCPGPGWVRGSAKTGKRWYNNGAVEMCCNDCPSGWSKGRLPTMQTHLKSIAVSGGQQAAQVRWGS